MSELVVDGAAVSAPAPATGPKPTVSLEFERGPLAPDYFALKVDGEIVEDRLDPADLQWVVANVLANASMTRDTDGNSRPDSWAWLSALNITGESVGSAGYRFSYDDQTTRSLQSAATSVAAPGQVWTASFTGLVETGPGQWWPRVEFLDAADVVLGGQDGAAQTGAAHRAEVTGAAPSGTAKVRAVAVVQNSAIGVAVYVLGFAQAEPAAAATAWTPGDGEAYRYTYYRARPRMAHTYEILAVQTDAGALKLSSVNQTDALTTEPSGIWLLVPDEDLAVVLAGHDEPGMEIGEDGETFTPGRKPVRITKTARGYEGAVSGLVIDKFGVTAEEYCRRLEAVKSLHNSVETRLVMTRYNIPVILGRFTGPTPNGEAPGTYRFGAEFWQVGEFAVAARA